MNIVFKNIEQTIITEINKAENWVKINVPWFTSVELLQSLFSAENRGVKVELIIEDDKINNKLKKLFEGLERLGATIILNRNKEKLNHEKFALIDGETLIYGSFNWTNKANLYNNESIFILNKNDNQSIIESYNNRFEAIKKSIVSKQKPSLSFDIKNNYYEQIDNDSENYQKPKLIPFRRDGKWGYCNLEKEVVVEPIYSEASRLSEGLAQVKNNANKWAFINTKAEFITPFKYDACKEFRSGWASVARRIEGDGWMGPSEYLQFGSIDKHGTQILPFKYAHIGLLSEGKVDFSPEENIGSYYDNGYDFDENLPKGIVDYNDVELTDRMYDLVYPCSEGLSLVGTKHHGNGATWNLYSYVDKYGNLLGDFDFTSADRFSNGFAAIQLNFFDPGRYTVKYLPLRHNYIDKTGDLIFDQNLRNAETFFKGTAYLEMQDKSMIVNTDFEEIFTCKISNTFTVCSNFYNGIAKYTDGKTYGYISQSGKIITECRYKYAGRYKYGVALASSGDGRYEFINVNGEKILECSLQDGPVHFYNNLGIIHKDGVSIYVDHDGEVYSSANIF